MCNLNADSEWDEGWIKSKITTENNKFTLNRATALLIAHNMQKKINTEYGVRELSL